MATGIEVLTGILGTALTGVVIWALKQGADFLGIKKDGELMGLVEDYIGKAVDKYDDKLTEIIESKGQDIAKKNELIGSVISWVNNNAPKIVKRYFGKNQEQLEEFVSNYIESLVKKEVEEMID